MSVTSTVKIIIKTYFYIKSIGDININIIFNKSSYI